MKTEGYEPFKDSSAYVPFTIENEDKYLSRLKSTNHHAFCVRRPYDSECTAENSNTNYSSSSGDGNSGGSGISREDMIQKIAAALKEAKK